MVDDATDEYAEVFASPADPARQLRYRVVGARSANGGEIGDVLISLDQRDGDAGPSPVQSTTATISDFRLRRRKDGTWKIVGWGEPAE